MSFSVPKIIRLSRAVAAFTIIELILIVVSLSLFILLMTFGLPDARRAASLKACANNLRKIGLAFRTFAIASNDSFGMHVTERFGGSDEAKYTGELFRHFQVMSNELGALGACDMLVCPTDNRRPAVAFTNGFSNTNISYFVGIDASDTNPYMFLCGDRNVTNGTSLTNSILALTTNQPSGWTGALHKHCGNVLLASGEVRRFNNVELNAALAQTCCISNRLQMPQ